jgi:hypothetical protein
MDSYATVLKKSTLGMLSGLKVKRPNKKAKAKAGGKKDEPKTD